MADGTVRCIDSETPFDIPDSWEWIRLGNIVSVGGGKRIPAGRKLTKEVTPQIYIRVSDMKNGEISDQDLHYVPNDIIPLISRYTISSDDIYITVAGTIGKVGIVPSKFNGANLTENADKLIIPEYNKLFLVLTLESPFVQQQISDVTTKVGQPKLAIARIEKLLIPVVPKEEQLRIVDHFNTLKHLINSYDTSFIKLQELNDAIWSDISKSILQEAIQGRLVPQIESEGTAEELLTEIRAEKKRLVKEGKLKRSALANESRIFRGDDNRYYEQIGSNTCDITDSIPFEIPDNWIWVRGRTVFLPMESTKPSMEIFTYIDLDAVDNKANVISKSKQVAKSNAPSRATRKLHKNDILFSMVRPYLRNIALVTSNYANAIASTGFYVITPSCGILPGYLFHMMLSSYVVDGLNKYMKGDNSPSINNSHIELFLYPLPPLKEQERIVCRINELFKQLK